MSTRDPRVRCRGCTRRLGRTSGAAVEIEVAGVVLAPDGVRVACPDCGRGRALHLPAPIRPATSRRAVIHMEASDGDDH